MIDENTWLILPMYHREKTICEAAKPGARGCNFKLFCSIMNLHVTYGAVFSLHWQTIYSLLRFYVRAASVARHLYIRAPAGVGSFTKIYGARKRNGSAPSHFMRSSQSVSRRVLQVGWRFWPLRLLHNMLKSGYFSSLLFISTLPNVVCLC